MSDMLEPQEAYTPQLNGGDIDLSDDEVVPNHTSHRPAVPPQRVRFATVAVLSFDGYEETFEVSILNLSDSGLACTGPRGMAIGDRLRLSFRLHLAEAPESFACEVVWVHEPDTTQTNEVGEDDEANYGMRFVGLDGGLSERVDAVVRERAEGRAAEWTLPVMPAPTPYGGEDFVLSVQAHAELASDNEAGDDFGDVLGQASSVLPEGRRAASMWAAASRRTETWVAAGAGLVVGLGLALAIAGLSPSDKAAKNVTDAATAAVDGAVDQAQEVAHAIATEAAPAVSAPPSAALAAAPSTPAPAATKPERGAVVPAKASTDGTAPAPLVTQRVRELAAAAAAATTAKAPSQLRASAPAAQQSGGAQPRIEGSRNRATLVLSTDGPAKDAHVFWMADPRRLVVDVPKRQSAVGGRLFDLDHAVVSRVRVGKHPDKVRFVVETGKDVMTQFSTRVQGNTVRVELSRP